MANSVEVSPNPTACIPRAGSGRAPCEQSPGATRPEALRSVEVRPRSLEGPSSLLDLELTNGGRVFAKGTPFVAISGSGIS